MRFLRYEKSESYGMQEEKYLLNEEEPRRGGVESSLADFGAVIKKRLIWILTAALLAALAMGLVTRFAISPQKVSYSLSFIVEYPDRDGYADGKLHYPNGEIFRYETLIYVDRLRAAKESNEDFAQIDVESMASGGISITPAATEGEETPIIYTLSVAGGYFSSEDQATRFLQAVCNETREKIVETATGFAYDAALLSYDSVSSFESKIEILENQHRAVLSRYEKYLSVYRNFTFEGKTIEACYAEASALFHGGAGDLDLLKTDLQYNGYLCKQTEQEVLIRISVLEREKALNTTACDALKETVRNFMSGSVLTDLDAYHKKISDYIDRNAQIDGEIEKLYRSIGYGKNESGAYEQTGVAADSTAFEEKLAQFYGAVENEAQICKKMIGALYEEHAGFRYEQGRAVISGGANAVVYAGLAFVGAFLVASLIALVVEGVLKRKKASSAPIGEKE